MPSSVITVGGNPVTLVAMPSAPGLRSVQFSLDDAVAVVKSPFTGQAQRQSWPGADMVSGVCELPKLAGSQAEDWKSFLRACRGRLNAFLLGDPAKTMPCGYVDGRSVPVVAGAGSVAGMDSLTTSGWVANQFRLLAPGDYFQLGYRLHAVVDPVNSDGSGNATLNIYPSLRETPAAGTPLVLANPQGLFALATNARGWTADYTRLTAMSFQVEEYR